jgi:hypothetical protein
MNKTEARYAQFLEGAKAFGLVKGYQFEAMRFRLADDTTYTPDFMVVLPDDRVELHEVKGAKIWDDSKVKFKVASEMYPMFGWRMLQWKGGVWTELRRYEPKENAWKGAHEIF